jgi:RND family efflux transporter MFP subunit
MLQAVRAFGLRHGSRRQFPSIALLAAALALAAVDAGAQQAALVGVDEVRSEQVSQTYPVIGRLVARNAGIISARVRGPVDEVRVEVGDAVEKNDVLAVLVRDRLRWELERKAADVAERRADLAARQSQVEIKSQELERLDRLRKSRSAAFRQAVYDDARIESDMLASQASEATARLKQATADLKLAELDLRDAEIRAPFAGVVTVKHIDAGAYVSVGAPVVTLVNDRDLEIEADVPADRISGLAPDGDVVVMVNGQPEHAVVRAIVPQENPLTRTRAVRLTPKFDINRGGLAVNQSVTVRVPITDARKVVSVHKDAILNRQGGNMVFVVEDGAAKPRQVVIGEAVGGRFIVVDGLKPGEKVVVRGNERLFPGQPVTF